MTVTVERAVVPEFMVTAALRLIHLEVKYHGVRSEDLYVWQQHPFPHLRERPEIMAIAGLVTARLHSEGMLCTPQIVWQLPDEVPEGVALEPHTDVPPDGHEFTLIAGVALTEWTHNNGALWWWDPLPQSAVLEPGDVVTMMPDTEHSPGINRGGLIRCGVYLRWTKEAA
jgi:ectoine hydroxylase-related dioxygenase (phytanoyl-CoA dioxygenase family)